MRWALRITLAVVLAAGALVSAVVAVRTAAGDAPTIGDRGGDPEGVATPLLSARRLPELLSTPLADGTLALFLDDYIARLPGGTCLVVHVDGRPIAAHAPDVPLTPASAQKLVTAAAALAEIGPEHRFRTAASAEVPPAGGVVEGDLWLVGGGDPVLVTDDYAARGEVPQEVRTRLEDLADALVAAGVTRVAGSVVGDGGRYDDQRYVAAWPPRFVDQNQTGPLGGLAVDQGFESYPTEAEPATEELPAADPALHAAGVLTLLLRDRGVVVDGAPLVGPVGAAAVELAAVESPELRDIVGDMLATSDNTVAELLLKEVGLQAGGEGSTAAGASAALASLERQGFDLDGIEAVDGSGLASGNDATCAFLVGLLESAGPDSDLAADLAVAGETGTLRRSFLGTSVEGRLRAKTGLLADVGALAGFVEGPAGEQVTFAFIVNGDLPTAVPIGLRTELGAILGLYPQRPPIDDLDPEAP